VAKPISLRASPRRRETKSTRHVTCRRGVARRSTTARQT